MFSVNLAGVFSSFSSLPLIANRRSQGPQKKAVYALNNREEKKLGEALRQLSHQPGRKFRVPNTSNGPTIIRKQASGARCGQ
jgi:hypothetical protein